MARMEDTVLRMFLELDRERGRLMGQIARNAQAPVRESQWALDGIESAVHQMRVVDIQMTLLERLVETTRKNTEWEKSRGV